MNNNNNNNNKYLDLTRELKKLWNMKVTIITIVIGAFGTVTKGLEYWEESWKLEETCCHSISCKKPSAYADVKNSNE